MESSRCLLCLRRCSKFLTSYSLRTTNIPRCQFSYRQNFDFVFSKGSNKKNVNQRRLWTSDVRPDLSPDLKLSFQSYRTTHCGEVNEAHLGSSQTLSGWIKFKRGLKVTNNLGFLVLTDHTGDIQISVDPRSGVRVPEGFQWEGVTGQSCMVIKGDVQLRPEKDINSEQTTGKFEVIAKEVLYFNPCEALPFNIHKMKEPPREDLRLTYRYLDLRRPEMQQMLRFRSTVINEMRKVLIDIYSFVEVETPTLFRHSPGGAREFIVPSSQPGHFYALTQSPQMFKQLLMVSGLDRYFQVARCYRDENQFSDRQSEFTQLDIETSFESRHSIQSMIETLIVETWPSSSGDPPETPFPRITYDYAMSNYGSDKPDMRFPEMCIHDVTKLLNQVPSKVFDEGLNAGFSIYGIAVKKANLLTGKEVNKVLQMVRKDLKWMVTTINVGRNGAWHQVPFKEFDADDTREKVNDLLVAEENDLICLSIGPSDLVLTMLGRIRSLFIEKLSESVPYYRKRVVMSI